MPAAFPPTSPSALRQSPHASALDPSDALATSRLRHHAHAPIHHHHRHEAATCCLDQKQKQQQLLPARHTALAATAAEPQPW